MLTIDIPGADVLQLAHLILDFNGTIAEDGIVLPSVVPRLTTLAQALRIMVVTADTHGTVAQNIAALPVELLVIAPLAQDSAKEEVLLRLGAHRCAAIGNGRNDALMLARAALGIGVIGPEGASARIVSKADIVCSRIEDALDLLIKPSRLRAILRN